MAKVVFSPDARKAFKSLDGSMKPSFAKHIIKLESFPPKKHLKQGLPYFIEEVGAGRLVCKIEGDTVFLEQLFTTHKEYERWYKRHF